MAIKSYILFFLLLVSPSLLAASFDCAKADLTVEKLICKDETLSRLDEQLAVLYKQALLDTSDKDAFKHKQIDWIKRRNVCNDTACLLQNYKNRLSGLNNEKGFSDFCYVSTQKLKDFSSADEKFYEVTDFLKITEKDEKFLSFELRVNGGNFHVCSVFGFAYQTKSDIATYTFRDEEKYWNGTFEPYGLSKGADTCEINFFIHEEEVRISSIGNCRAFCGARAAINSKVMKTGESCNALKL